MPNQNIKSTIISPTVRVSSAIIHYPNLGFGEYCQYETIVFGLPDGMHMEIHGTSASDDNPTLINEAIDYHDKMVEQLKQQVAC